MGASYGLGIAFERAVLGVGLAVGRLGRFLGNEFIYT